MDDLIYVEKMEKSYENLESFTNNQDKKAISMITIISAMFTLQLSIFLPKIQIPLTKYFCVLSLICYSISIFTFILVINSKKFKLSIPPNLIINSYNNNVSKEEYVSIMIKNYSDALKHNKKIMDEKSRLLKYGFHTLIPGIFLTIITTILFIL